MTISSEAVGLALSAFYDKGLPPDAQITERLRAALEAVAPMLIAQGLREAATVVLTLPPKGGPEFAYHQINRACDAILARAQELDPQ
jgi:hypothetical protein